jgi:ubiquitin-like protein Pup
MEQQQIQKAPSKRAEPEVAEPTKAERNEKLKKDLDDIIDDIDEVLEDNAEEFVASYVQKGGE